MLLLLRCLLLQVMGRSVGNVDDVDEAELDAELEMLESELDAVGESGGVEEAGLPDYLPEAPNGAPAMPVVPAGGGGGAAEQPAAVASPAASGGLDEFGLPLSGV